MLRLAGILLAVALFSALLGFTEVSALSGPAKVLFFVSLLAFTVTLVAGIARRPPG